MNINTISPDSFCKILTYLFGDIYDTNGKLISTNSVEKSTSNSYIHNLDMGQVSPGVYLIQLGNSNTGFKTSRIIVK